MPYAEQYQLAR